MSQLLTLIWLKWRLLRNSLRSRKQSSTKWRRFSECCSALRVVAHGCADSRRRRLRTQSTRRAWRRVSTFARASFRSRVSRVHLLFDFRIHVPDVGHCAFEYRRQQAVRCGKLLMYPITLAQAVCGRLPQRVDDAALSFRSAGSARDLHRSRIGLRQSFAADLQFQRYSSASLYRNGFRRPSARSFDANARAAKRSWR